VKTRLLILFVWTIGLGFAQDLQSQARTAVFEKRYSDALTAYRNLLAEKPGNVDYILWIARLSAWTGDFDGAANSYSKALELEPQNIDALVGKANLLMWKKSYREAAALLTEARELAPSSNDVELAWARYYHYLGEDANAKPHVKKVLDSDSENQEALHLSDSLIADHTVEVRIAYEGDTLPGTSPGEIEEVSVSYINRNGLIGIDFAHLVRFGEDGSRGGMHFSRKLDDKTSVRGAALVGGGGDIVAKLDLSAGISRKIQRGWVLGADYRHIAFRTLTVDAAIADLDYYFEKPVWIQTSYAADRAGGELSPGFLVRVHGQVRKNLSMNAGYAHGTEVFGLALPTQFGNFSEDSYIAGLNLTLSRKTRVENTYTLGRRATGTLENMFLIAIVHTL
jgi:YaiO family outer membrane protein